MKSMLPVAMAVMLAGCAGFGSSEPDSSLPDIPENPSSEWVRTHLPAFQEAAAENPTEGNLAAVNHLQRYADAQGKQVAKLQQVNRALTVAWGNQGRGGAAIRQSAYVHVLGESFNERQARLSAQPLPTVTDQDLIGDALKRFDEAKATAASSVGQGYSLYELSRWERFCDHGQRMDEDDWRFVTQEGGLSSVPAHLSDSCSPPSSDYPRYLSAWTRFCESTAPSASDLDIVRNTSRPKSVVNPCEALLK